MSAKKTDELSGEILEEVRLTLTELSSACRVETAYIVELVEEGVIDPESPDADPLVFRGSCIKRVRTAIHLQRDLGVNLPGVALALELMQRLDPPYR